MAQILETLRSREGRIGYVGGDITLEYDVWYASSLAAAYALLWSTIPDPFVSGFGSLNPKDARWTNLDAPDMFRFQVRYGSNNNGAGLTPDRLSVRIGSNTAHITNSLATLNRLRPPDMGFAGTNLKVDATTDTVVVPDGYTPVGSDVGYTITVYGGGGVTAGTYTISGITTSGGVAAWTLATSPAAAGSTGGVWAKAADVPTGTNLTMDATTAALAAPDGYTPTAGDVGRSIVVTGGTGFTPGVYAITEIAGGKWLLASAPAALAAAGGTWYMIGTGTDFGGAIGVSRDSVAGCDIVVPAMEFTISQSYATLTLADLVAFRALVGTVNDAPFLGTFPTGTCLYLGSEPTSGEGDLSNAQDYAWWNLGHRFRYEPDVTDVAIGSMTLPLKPGHAYLWVRYQPAAVANVLTVPPAQVNVEQVYKYADFDALGITL